ASLADGSALPAWLSFDAATRLFSGTPPQDFTGTVDLRVAASDGTAEIFSEFTLTVAAENDAPIVVQALSDQSVQEDQAWQYTLPQGTFADADGDDLTLSAGLADGSALPAWLSFDAATRLFSGTPPQDFTGTVDLRVTASDGTAEVFSDFTLTVAAENDAPIVVQTLSDQSVREDQAWQYTLPQGTFADADGDDLTLSASLADGSELPAWLSFDAATRLFSGTPPQDFTGTVDLRVTASDGTAEIFSDLTLTVAAENDAPIVVQTLSDQSVQEDQAWQYTLP
ncbi:hypothetical protein RA27_22830, partial [Ruegeria sp. ANG-R]|uniref:putative Ig domain-containing protein n=1 Tax=Ruegeria sp. ANG-R TaxID=1577903 RepID=UPI00057F9D26